MINTETCEYAVHIRLAKPVFTSIAIIRIQPPVSLLKRPYQPPDSIGIIAQPTVCQVEFGTALVWKFIIRNSQSSNRSLFKFALVHFQHFDISTTATVTRLNAVYYQVNIQILDNIQRYSDTLWYFCF